MFDITPRQRQVLDLYRRFPEANYSEIADLIKVRSKNSVFKLAMQLVEKGYLTFEPARRKAKLTDKALAL
jgi:DNA-binding IclR family transcriptional regulator